MVKTWNRIHAKYQSITKYSFIPKAKIGTSAESWKPPPYADTFNIQLVYVKDNNNNKKI